jgi:myo-inositol-1(or 4)-monophosphatase
MKQQNEVAQGESVMAKIDVSLIMRLVREAGDWLLSEFPRIQPPLTQKATYAAFEEINGALEERLKAGLAAAYPAIPWSAQEYDLNDGKSAPKGEIWLCDPIDGAVQYLHRLPYWAMSLVLLRDGDPVFSLVYDAVHGEMFHAVAGGGAFLNGSPITAGKKTSLADAVAVSTQPTFVGRDPVATRQSGVSVAKMLPLIFALRNLGSYQLQLAYVAAGRLDIYWEYGEDLSNWLAASLLLREAGAAVSDIQGRPFGWESQSFVATAPALHAPVLKVLATVE